MVVGCDAVVSGAAVVPIVGIGGEVSISAAAHPSNNAIISVMNNIFFIDIPSLSFSNYSRFFQYLQLFIGDL